MKINVMLADDHPALVAGIEYALNGDSTVVITGTARDSGALVRLLDTAPCDVLVVDYSMPGGLHGDGLTFLTYLRLRYPNLRIVVFTMLSNPAIVRDIAKAGIHSVVHKSGDLNRLVSAIYTVYSGARYFLDCDGWSDLALTRLSTEKCGGPELSPREAEILRLYVSGMTTREMANHLKLAKQTVSAHKVGAMRKLGIKREVDLLRYAIDSGISAADSANTSLTNSNISV